MLALLAEAWKARPDLRLGQIVSIAAYKGRRGPDDYDPFYVEDDAMADGLRKLE